MINIIIAVASFFIGATLGSFYTLAIYRIPLNKDITHERSFCPNCNHKLGFADLIPVFSYIFLGGKCRYCGEKIKIRYLLIELASAFIFMLYIISLNIDYFNIQMSDYINIIFGIIYLSVLAITAGINLDKRIIDKKVLVFNSFLTIIYMLYLYILGVNIYRYVIYFIIIIGLLIIDKVKQNYILEFITYIFFVLLFVGTEITIIALILTIISIFLKKIFNIINKNNEKTNIPIVAYFSFIIIGLLIIQNAF